MDLATKLPVAPTASPETSPRTLRVRSKVRAGGHAEYVTQTQTGGIIRLRQP